MKKSILISTTLVVLTLSATSIYAQVSGGSSLITKMKAAAANFTLASELNPGQTGLQSAPVSGKKTGDILTAGEWNRVLEIIASAGGGISDVELITSQAASPSAAADYSFRVSQANCPAGKKVISGGCSYPNTLNTFVHNTPTPDLSGWICGGLHHDGDTTNNATKYPYRPTAYAVCGTYGTGGSGSSGSGWVDVPLTDTADFDKACEYRFYMNAMGLDAIYYVNVVAPTTLIYISHNSVISSIPSNNKTSYQINGSPAFTVSKIEKLCGGGVGGSGSGGLALYKCTNAQSMDSTNAPCYGASRNGGAGTNQYRVVSCTDNDGTRSYTMSSILNFGQLVANKWAVSVNGGTIECDDGTVLVMDTQSSGGASVASSWTDISLEGSTDFDIGCEYRAYVPKNAQQPQDSWKYFTSITPKRLDSPPSNDSQIYIPNTDKKAFYITPYGRADAWGLIVTKIQKRCN